MPLVYTNHRDAPSLEHELRELWRRIDWLVMTGAQVTPAGIQQATAGEGGGVAAETSAPPGNAYARVFAMMGA